MVATDVKEVVLDGSGHFVPEEQPDAVVNEILALRSAKLRRERGYTDHPTLEQILEVNHPEDV